jgi:hypothetical protein
MLRTLAAPVRDALAAVLAEQSATGGTEPRWEVALSLIFGDDRFLRIGEEFDRVLSDLPRMLVDAPPELLDLPKEGSP